MNSKRTLTHLFLFFFLWVYYCSGQGPFISPSKALGPNVLGCSIKDKQGNLWFGTSERGVFRYDGKVFTHFSEKDGISDDHIFSMLEDRSGTIWVGTFSGLYQYNGARFTKVVIPHTFKSTAPDAMGNTVSNPDCILSLFQDKQGNIWLGSMGCGVYCYNGTSFTFFQEVKGLNSAIVQSMVEDQHGILWMGTRGNGVWTYDGKSFKNFNSKLINNNHVLDILEDNKGDLWFSSVGGGVRHFIKDPKLGSVEYNDDKAIELSKKDNLCFQNVFSMFQDKSGKIWFCGDGGGVCVFDGQLFTSYTTENGLINNRVVSVLEDNKGNIWLGTRGGGLCCFDGKTFSDFSDQLK